MRWTRSNRPPSPGFTLVEAMIVVAIAGVLSMLAIPMMLKYRLAEDTRSHANYVARVLSEARSQALARGAPTYILFANPNLAPAVVEYQAGAFALVVNDDDANGQVSAGETFQNYFEKAGTAAEVTGYGVDPTMPFNGQALPPEDQSGFGANLGAVVNAATFPNDPATGVPAVGFNAQGIPVSLQTPTAWGSGAGAYYVTDNDRTVYAVILLPLGGVRIRGLAPSQGVWR